MSRHTVFLICLAVLFFLSWLSFTKSNLGSSNNVFFFFLKRLIFQSSQLLSIMVVTWQVSFLFFIMSLTLSHINIICFVSIQVTCFNYKNTMAVRIKIRACTSYLTFSFPPSSWPLPRMKMKVRLVSSFSPYARTTSYINMTFETQFPNYFQIL